MHHWTTHSGYTIYQVLGFRCNVFLLTNRKTHLLIDCGSKRYRSQLVWNLAKLGVSHIDALLLTHTHFDHAGNSHYIQNRFGASVIVHQNEAPYLRSGDAPLPKGTNWLMRFIINHFGSIAAPLFTYQPCLADHIVDKKFSLSKYGFNSYIMHTPGHSIGSMSIVVDEEIALAGDALFGVFPGSAFPPFADNETQLINSWILLLNSGVKLFIPSHGRSRSRELLQKCLNKRTQKSPGS